MARVMKTPGVYTVEKDAFPNSVVEVATAVPAFVGYTQRTTIEERSLLNKPRLVSSMAEFHLAFGGAPRPTYTLGTATPADDSEAPMPAGSSDPIARLRDGTAYFLRRTSARFHLYHSLQLFYQNGGDRCYVVSIGSYDDTPDAASFQTGLDSLRKEQEPTMVVMPDAVLLSAADCGSAQQAALRHCGGEMRSRVAILDIHQGYRGRSDNDPVAAFHGSLRADFLDFASAYYPWVETTLVEPSTLGLANLDANGWTALAGLLRDEGRIEDEELLSRVTEAGLGPQEAEALDRALIAGSPIFNRVLEQIRADANLLPPSGAIAGIYTLVDSSRGVWEVPANVPLNSVIRPAVDMAEEVQIDLQGAPDGRSVNLIGTSAGGGTIPFGARTLDGNSLVGGHINVRRTMIMLEQSIKLATKAYVFEANDANTWTTIKQMIRNFLTRIWKRGGLVGASPDDAFNIQVGLGETMTSEEILQGILRVTVRVAVTRPAEFVDITFEQQMQES